MKRELTFFIGIFLLLIAGVIAVCEDSDRGINYNEQGSVSTGGCWGGLGLICLIQVDSCSDSETLIEYYCNENNVSGNSETYTCPSSCVDGACVDYIWQCHETEYTCDGNIRKPPCFSDAMEEDCSFSGKTCDDGVCVESDDEDEDDDDNPCTSEEDCLNSGECNPELECTCAGGKCHQGFVGGDDEDDDKDDDNQGLGHTIRNRVKAGVYTNEEGEEIRVSEMAQNRIKLKVKETEVESELEIESEEENYKTKLKVKLSNGRNAEIKIMPNTASEKALERLKLKVCSEENECQIELKEVGKGEESKLAYELRAKKQGRFLGIFKMKMDVESQIDAENGEVISTTKPWWAFLVAEE